ncbi:RnfABCDGE type electron transport complex subunit G [Clostridium saccharobutylicum]|uniref:Ion-translocating oxidoreductase complex subunit G n=1 Tax=Clostridium saccharobutylicum DSM 13864 TaxID=1345695 RepID=U5MLV5_CLOSA|nr:RnfABCDGE type electron transport complex subunit G [Clostridium saccharobutylicum]AGX41575.1 electron transport complex, RnfABCDGE type, G subunit [Clostridium saccharobutylicum DSM 13864]AQR88855.1 electron transport complex subunit RsxG [Clostridium saccharobutylicum]AQR98754.1 electron transport complex subunit RsxG [Clostridium saccharobutylicum]AQS08476.1 electron transport complex subunit RsxG [Clostridium saccharobutylicum]AQS12744.1 electron transport complex subunit RsxG [Clostrid
MEGAHVNKEYSIFQIAINLIITCLVSGLIIGLVYYFTAPIAAEKKEVSKQESMRSLVSDADNFKAVPDKDQWFTAEKDGKIIAYVVPGESKGYGGEIKMLVAVKPDGEVIDYSITTSNETPGLGDNASKQPFKDEFKGKKEANLTVTKDASDKDDIQAMTGATISSRAVTLAVKNAVHEVTDFTGGK